MSSDRVLQTWKEIAEYVGRTERTVQRWEQEFGFPVHRPAGKARSAVMALAKEIQEWATGKPSLVAIRSSARVSRAKLSSGDRGQGNSNHPPDSHAHFKQCKVLQESLKEQLRFSRQLWKQHKSLCVEMRKAFVEQARLYEKLKQSRDKTFG